jgi:hypothetical protein
VDACHAGSEGVEVEPTVRAGDELALEDDGPAVEGADEDGRLGQR